ncbi:MAG: hypothetical protein LBK42_00960 [Propionibacteriaceae bacterium]|jgi:hypothetical protein|nr:hypothetical protein [Propionibacteriaceae bacterium]
MRWEQGRATIEAMLAAGELQRVPPSRDHADRLLGQAGRLATGENESHSHQSESG